MRAEREQLVRWVIEVVLSASDLSSRTSAAIKSCCPIERPILVSIGKASTSMALGALASLKGGVEGGIVVIPSETGAGELRGYGLEVLIGGHPIPDRSSLKAGEAALEWARQARARGLSLLSLISGGSSAMVEAPLEPLTLEDVVEANRILLTSGASISEMNIVRRHLSKIKGGGLVKASRPSRVYGLYASDVPGDVIYDIGSGPTAPDPTTYMDALTVLKFYGLLDRVPGRVRSLLERGAKGLVEETLKPGSPDSERAQNLIIARNLDVLEAVERLLKTKGFNTIVLTSMLQGESREVGKALASIAVEAKRSGRPLRPPVALIAGGETTVTVRGDGKGGRNQELALSWAIETRRLGLVEDDALLLAVATDGIDGPTDAAGAAVTPSIVDDMTRAGVNPLEALARNDSYSVLNASGSLIRTGKTGTNLNNVIVMFVW
ncbi:MAG: glycerate kinase type-2 family protein [Acidilobus sp.]